MQRGPDYGKRKEREKQFSVWLPMEVWERLRTRAFKDRRSMATLTRAAISQYLNRGGK